MTGTSSTSPAPKCVIDRAVLNATTVSKMTDIGLSIFAPLCGRNRGAFVLDPTNGATYGCVEFPSNFGDLAGVPTDVIVKDANAIKVVYQAGNVTSGQVVDLLDLYIQSVYNSSPSVDQDVHACDVGGLAVLQCPSSAAASTGVLRAVTLAGLFVDAPWATGGRSLSYDQARGFYTAQDFHDMRKLGLNTVRIPFYTSDFNGGDNQSLLTDILSLVSRARLSAVLVLIGNDTTAIAPAATYAASHSDVVTALTLPSADFIRAARDAAPSLTLMVPVSNEAELTKLNVGTDTNIVAALDLNHVTTVADVASSDSLNDRMKLYYHESVACTQSAPLEYSKCFLGIPAFVATGFDLSIDNCFQKGISDTFVDYGQCNRFDETENSDWWAAHRKSFAEKQIFSYEKGLGWSFSAWKLYGETHVGVIDSPAKLLSFKDVSSAGLLPPLDGASTALACLNPPASDFVLGDDTLAPSPGPPPDCGNGWWNFDLQACEYWIPPTPPPTQPCPECPDCPVPVVCDVCPRPLTNTALAQAAVGGGALALLLGFIGLRLFGRSGGYTALPT